MKTYRVYQDGIRCKDYKVKGWDTDTFNTKREAEVFATLWCYPVSFEHAPMYSREMPLNQPVDMSMCEFPVWMEIREVSE